MRRAFFILLLLLASCGGGTNEEQPFQPGTYEGRLDVHVDRETSGKNRKVCGEITKVFLQGGIYRITIIDDGSDLMTVAHESREGIEVTAEIDHRQTAFGTSEKGEVFFDSNDGGQGRCEFTFRGHFQSRRPDMIYVSGSIEGKCKDSTGSVDCVFRHDMTMDKRLFPQVRPDMPRYSLW